MQDTALLVIEAQREWLDPGGRLAGLVVDRDDFERAATALRRLLEAGRRAQLPVFHIHMSYRQGHPELGHGDFGLRRAIRDHEVWTGEGREPAAGFEPLSGELVIAHRTGASAFAGSQLDSVLRNNGVRRLIIGGFAAHVCVLATVMHAHDLGYTAIVPHETMGAFTAAQREFVIREIAYHFAWSKPLEATLEHLERRAGVARATRAFLDGVVSGDSAAVAEVLDPEIVVEGMLDGIWQRWDKDKYLARVAALSATAAGQTPRAEVVRLELVGAQAEVETRLELPGGRFHDRLGFGLAGKRWLLRHKELLFHPAAH